MKKIEDEIKEYVADGSMEAYITSDGELKLRKFRPEITQTDVQRVELLEKKD